MKYPIKLILIFCTVVLLATGISTIGAKAHIQNSGPQPENRDLEETFALTGDILSVAFSEGLNYRYRFFNQREGEGKVIFGGSYTLHSGEVLIGDLVVLGGEAILEEGSTLKGSAVIFGGKMQASGEINGEVVTFGGEVALAETAVVKGDIVSFGGVLDYEEETKLEGNLISDIPFPFDFSYSGDFDFSEFDFPQFGAGFNPVRDIIWFFFRSFMWTAVAVLLLIFIPKPIRRVSDTVVSQPIVSGALGLLTALLAPIVLILLIITLICIPISLLLIIALGLAWVLGVVAIGYETGERISKMMNKTWAPPVSAGIGTLILTFVLNGIGLVVPCIGWIAPALVGLVGFGAVLLTRFGSQEYPPVESVPVLNEYNSTGSTNEIESSGQEQTSRNRSSAQSGQPTQIEDDLS